MNAKELSRKLDGMEYGAVIDDDLLKKAEAAGLVVVFGASDDLMEFRGAIYDEVGVYDGGQAYLTPVGLLQNKCDEEECPYFEAFKKSAVTVKAVWGAKGYSWIYETSIPHETFEIEEEGDPYCRGIVFLLSDVRS